MLGQTCKNFAKIFLVMPFGFVVYIMASPNLNVNPYAEQEQKIAALEQSIERIQNKPVRESMDLVQIGSLKARLRKVRRSISMQKNMNKLRLARQHRQTQDENDEEAKEESPATNHNSINTNPNFNMNADGVRRSQRVEFQTNSCTLCNEKFKFLNELMLHLQTKHNKQHLFKQNKPTNNEMLHLRSTAQESSFGIPRNNLERQVTFVEQMNGSKKACSICFQEFKTCYLVVQHIREVHNNENLKHCKICKRDFASRETLSVHIRRVHNKEKPYQCHICQKRFGWSSVLKKHISSFHNKERNHICPICSKGFSSKYTVKIHQRIHTGEKPYQCTNCPKKFAYKCLLKWHQEKQKH